jgi:uncharacterized protein (TIGR03000 family)
MGSYTCGACWGGGCAGTDYAPTYVSPPTYLGPPGKPTTPPPAGGTAPEVAPPPKPKPEEKKPAQGRLIIELPAQAKLYIDDHLMKTTSAHRTFRTPELQPGQTYYYIVRAELNQDGKRYSERKRVLIRAGQTVQLGFNELASARNEVPKSVASASK